MTPQELAQMIWNIKEIIRDDYNDKNVDEVIFTFYAVTPFGLCNGC